MKLTNQMKQAWMNNCAERLLPSADEAPKAIKTFLREIYDSWYAKEIQPFKHQNIVDLVPEAQVISVELKSNGETLADLKYICAQKAGEHPGNWYSASSFYSQTRETNPARQHGDLFKYAPADNRYSTSVKVDLTDDQRVKYEALKETARADALKYIELVSAVWRALDTTNTDTALKTDYPAIYANMPSHVRIMINADIEKKSANKRRRDIARAEAKLNQTPYVAPPTGDANVMDAFKVAELALQKAAFVNS